MDRILRGLIFFRWMLLTGLLGLTPAEVRGWTNDVLIEIRPSPEGRFIYERNCVACHGVLGDGRGEMGLTVKPPPRDFAIGVFKYRSTPGGFLPTDADLARTVREGVSDTAMPAFSNLSEREVRAVVQYLKSFSRRWRNPENYAAPITISERPGWFEDAVASKRHVEVGRVLYVLSCAPCHGLVGDGKGSVTNLMDSWGNPAPARDLRLPYIRSGHRIEDIYKVLVTGLDGTPMPSFRETLTEDEKWNLVALIEQMRRDSVKRD